MNATSTASHFLQFLFATISYNFSLLQWGATAKVEHILKRRPVYVDSSMLEETAVSIGTHPAWVSTDGSRNTVDLDLLSGPIPKTELPDMPSSAGDHSVSRDKDEISILTDPSVGHGSQTFNAS